MCDQRGQEGLVQTLQVLVRLCLGRKESKTLDGFFDPKPCQGTEAAMSGDEEPHSSSSKYNYQ